ncbi:MAG TPA: ATP-binding protein [Pelagibacterium sp.]|uniref:two-component system sensor histidine kinase NtrB n=1 Tax=Pelagibacterium sp. TaxID=1967288 RepID=UPI002CA80A4A|nr:ATP-binding protein [Pelagibacterium sp.]HWJ88886.1 ATP-binding protein [Pelagibacterium sp.]
MTISAQADLHGQILHALPQPVLVCARDGAIIFANYAAETFFQASASILTRHKLADFLAVGSPVLGLVEAVTERQAPMSEYRVLVDTARMAHERSADVYASPLPDRPDHVTLIFQERTMADKIDRQMGSRGAVRSVTGLAAMLAHEIKNPLSGIRGAAQLLEQGADGDDRVLARLIRDETDRIVGLVDRMEAFGDDRPADRKPVNIHVVLDRVNLLAANGVAKGVAFVHDYDPSLPPVMGDRDQLIQAFLNLIKNSAEAIDKTLNPEIRITTAFRPGMWIGEGGAQKVSLPLEIMIEDNGPGVPADILPYLFDPFISTKLTGSGLGLALVAKIIGDHGGVIDCESRPGRTAFRILLPVARSGETSDHEDRD